MEFSIEFSIESLKQRRLYYTSDIHHEMRSNKSAKLVDIIPVEPTNEELQMGMKIRNFLALCGDIGNPYDSKYEEFLARHSERLEYIFVISGNHEYYSNQKQRPMPKIDEKIYEICSRFPNIHFLQKNIFSIDTSTKDETVFAGCTLWTPVDETAEAIMNDYRKIYAEDEQRNSGLITITNIDSFRLTNTFGARTSRRKYIRENRRLLRWRDILQLHGEMTDWLEIVVKIPVNKIIVLTHHAPSAVMLGNRGGGASSEMMPSINDGINTSNYYASNCEYLFIKPVVCWISCHTHHCISSSINGIPCLSNCWGYPDQKTNVDSKKYFVF